jgi:hypothetical protein
MTDVRTPNDRRQRAAQPNAWALFGGIVAAYVLSRGIAKAGSKEGPFIVRGGTAEQ